MSIILQILAACLLGGLLSMLVAFLILQGLPKRWLTYCVSFSTGVLLSTAILQLLPESLKLEIAAQNVFSTFLVAILFFFILEKTLIWRHFHDDSGLTNPSNIKDSSLDLGHHHSSSALGILIGDGFHNFTDGVLITVAFLTDPAIGWATTIAVVSHEIPQEAGDFIILVDAGWEKKRALLWNGISSLTSVVGAVIAYVSIDFAKPFIPFVLVIAAACFVYIAISDLLPRLKMEFRGLWWHALYLLAGILVALP